MGDSKTIGGLALVSVALALAGCGNPSIDDKVDALGGEVTGVTPSEWHRSGQPCVLCHGPYVGDAPEMSVAGSVFGVDDPDITKLVPVENVKVHVTDSFAVKRDFTTNCMGTFFDPADPTLGFPLEVSIECPDPAKKGKFLPPITMKGRIGRDGSCASCHFSSADPTAQTQTPGFVSCQHPGYPEPTADCPGIPAQ